VWALLHEKPWLLDELTGEDELRVALGEQVTATHAVGAISLARLSLSPHAHSKPEPQRPGVQALLGEARPAADQMFQNIKPAG
jgi:hypothetical protein